VQSSAATVGIAIAMASEGLLSLPAGIALALGANIGTAVTTAFMGILSSKSTEAVRASVVHVVFNLLGTALWLPLIWLLVDIAVWISPVSSELSGGAQAAADVPRQIANANTLFNVINTMLFIGFTGWFARLAEILVADKTPAQGLIIEPKYLDPAALKAPSLALENVRLEIARAGDVALSMYGDMREAMSLRNRSHLQDIARRDDQVDILEAAILDYLSLIRQGLLTEEESRLHQQLMTVVVNLEGLADIIESDLVALADTYIEQQYQSGETTRDILAELYERIGEAIAAAIKAVRDNDQRAAEQVMHMKSDIARLSEAFLSRKSERLGVTDEAYLAIARLEMSLVDRLRHIYTVSKRIAKVVLPLPLAGRG
jgi:phosphate:Na+ symporter